MPSCVGTVMKFTTALMFGVPLLTSADSLAHGGGLDKLGCHHHHKRGGYHCHRGPLKGQQFGSKAEALGKTPKNEGSSNSRPFIKSYDRSLYRHWVDADGDCLDTRQEVLVAESQIPAELDERGCRVISGRWFDPYTGRKFTNPQLLDIDHLVPLAEAHRSGADKWDSERREAFANDLSNPESLIAVSAKANRSKGDRDPAKWLPPNEQFRCEYIASWVKVKNRWALTTDGLELSTILRIQKSCPINGEVK